MFVSISMCVLIFSLTRIHSMLTGNKHTLGSKHFAFWSYCFLFLVCRLLTYWPNTRQRNKHISETFQSSLFSFSLHLQKFQLRKWLCCQFNKPINRRKQSEKKALTGGSGIGSSFFQYIKTTVVATILFLGKFTLSHVLYKQAP